jgi:hypothetical protein
LHVDTCVGESLEMVFASLRVDEMERLIPPVKAIPDERAKHAVLLVDAIEERADVTMLTESRPEKIWLSRDRCGQGWGESGGV